MENVPSPIYHALTDTNCGKTQYVSHCHLAVWTGGLAALSVRLVTYWGSGGKSWPRLRSRLQLGLKGGSRDSYRGQMALQFFEDSISFLFFSFFRARTHMQVGRGRILSRLHAQCIMSPAMSFWERSFPSTGSSFLICKRRISLDVLGCLLQFYWSCPNDLNPTL